MSAPPCAAPRKETLRSPSLGQVLLCDLCER